MRRYLTLRQKADVMLRQGGKCSACGKRLVVGLFQYDHRQDLQFDGDNELDNWQAICTKPCHAEKTRAASKARAHHERMAVGGKAKMRRPMDGSKASRYKKHLDGTVTLR